MGIKPVLKLSEKSKTILTELIKEFSSTEDKRIHEGYSSFEFEPFGISADNNHITIPPINYCKPEFKEFRESLPIFQYRNQILSAINAHQVVVISSETGKLQ